ncbi:hypothetical protein [Bradyrhizobium pachyrhizi]|uniref:hypothetical protein n=1 Tax=Bradyrhizobium pachyrhizi TaxID=280333 RepID=UPI0012E383FC|nr:hypothetical protein [Bradyrhizobium pachyrhizi]
MWFWIEAAWNFVFGWAGVDMIVGAACVAVAVFETWIINSLPAPLGKLIPDLRKWAIAAAVVAFTCTGLMGYGYRNGVDFTKSQWAAGLAREAVEGTKIRSDAERDIGPVSSDRRMFQRDPDNRDRDGADQRSASGAQGTLRRLAPNYLFRK